MPAFANTERDVIRTTAATLNGVPLTCVLLSGPGNAPTVTTGRNWNETEECIDPQSGALVVHSLAPGRYALYDYSNATPFHGHLFPKKVTVTEGANTVIEIVVDSLEDLSTADAALFVPTEQMKAKGAATEEAGALKIQAFPSRQRMTFSGNTVFQPVVVFGLLTPSGEILEAHSLQPSDPNSSAAVEAVKGMHLSMRTAPGATPQEHFLFVTERFASSTQ